MCAASAAVFESAMPDRRLRGALAHRVPRRRHGDARAHGRAVFPVVFGVMVWAALYLRDPRLRALLPLR
jgi:hypothetical protein